MTDVQKEQLARMKTAGYSYRQIAEELRVPLNTIKSFCRRHRQGKSAVPVAEGKCLLCGQSITQSPGRKPKKFCSDVCRMKWWNVHRKLVSMASAHEYSCLHCGRKFKSYGQRKYCCHECYIEDRFGGEALEQGGA